MPRDTQYRFATPIWLSPASTLATILFRKSIDNALIQYPYLILIRMYIFHFKPL
ncbi:MAG: hypothetical protein ACAI35_13490 [Candidatus Methylacidiphilales bacterium]|nr:hypothetical protein [Candidatus Methylacidiphilales bacterium]